MVIGRNFNHITLKKEEVPTQTFEAHRKDDRPSRERAGSFTPNHIPERQTRRFALRKEKMLHSPRKDQKSREEEGGGLKGSQRKLVEA